MGAGPAPVRYEIDAGHPSLRSGMIRVREMETGAVPVARAGTRYRRLDGVLLTPMELAQGATVVFRHWASTDSVLHLEYDETIEGRALSKRFDLSMAGGTLVLRAHALQAASGAAGNYAGLSLGPGESMEDPRRVLIPYMEAHPVVMAGPPGNRYFYSAYLDWTRSGSNAPKVREGPTLIASSSILDGFASHYVSSQDGLAPPLDETAYLTLSRDVVHVLLGIRRPPSPYRAVLDDRVAFDVWGEVEGLQGPLLDRFKNIRRNLEQLHAFGLERLVLIVHAWQSLGYDCGLPIHYPANPDYGGESDLKALLETAAQNGDLVALHQNYTYAFENSGAYWAGGAGVARNPDGSFQGFLSQERNCPASPASYKLAPDRMVDAARTESARIQLNYAPGSAFLDITPGTQADYFVDHSSANLRARTIRDGFALNLSLNRLLQETFKGPLLAEGNSGAERSQPYAAGTVDGVEAEILGRENALVIPDFELRVVKPLMANHGMGYYGRWIGSDPGQRGNLRLANYPLDKYRATEIAFGHAGYLSAVHFGVHPVQDFHRNWVKEYYSVRSLQREYLSADVSAIRYQTPQGIWLDLSQALAAELDFTRVRLREDFANGLQIYVNRDPSQTWTVAVQGREHYLPPNGWLAANPSSGLFLFSALVDEGGRPSPTGRRVDYVRAPDYILVDPRNSPTPVNFGPDFFGNDIRSQRLMVFKPTGWTLAEQPDGSLSTATHRGAPGTTVGGVGSGGGLVEGVISGGRQVALQVPSGSFPAGVIVALSAVAPSAACGTGAAAVRVTSVPAYQPLRSLRLTIGYDPSEVAAISPSRLAIVRQSQNGGGCVPYPSSADASARTVSAEISHLSDFQLAQVDPAAAVGSARLFPNPFYSSRQAFVTLDRVPAGSRVRVFTLHGELVYEREASASGLLTWGGANPAGRPVASGIYLVVVEGGGGTEVLKLALVR